MQSNFELSTMSYIVYKMLWTTKVFKFMANSELSKFYCSTKSAHSPSTVFVYSVSWCPSWSQCSAKWLHTILRSTSNTFPHLRTFSTSSWKYCWCSRTWWHGQSILQTGLTWSCYKTSKYTARHHSMFRQLQLLRNVLLCVSNKYIVTWHPMLDYFIILSTAINT